MNPENPVKESNKATIVNPVSFFSGQWLYEQDIIKNHLKKKELYLMFKEKINVPHVEYHFLQVVD